MQVSSPPYDFKEHQALLKRVAANWKLEVEELAEESSYLFSVILFLTPAQVATKI